ncbi:MAG: winged helix-turn-helix domain-containing protein [Candidatus Bathyarchaeum tardum]|nr:MAG: winged helix-turn-helix domain-containing protein [Candidatus Bathyarchaeum tardum]
MSTKNVKIISNPEGIRVLADPVRREILRIIQDEPQTQTQLARELNLSKPSVKHHVQLLLHHQMIKIAFTKIESHGIIQKYFEPTSSLLIEDFEKTPINLQKYFLQFHIERLRGMLSVLQLTGSLKGQLSGLTSKEIKELAQEIAKKIAKVGKKYQKTNSQITRETLLIMIYSEALDQAMSEDMLQSLFEKNRGE